MFASPKQAPPDATLIKPHLSSQFQARAMTRWGRFLNFLDKQKGKQANPNQLFFRFLVKLNKPNQLTFEIPRNKKQAPSNSRSNLPNKHATKIGGGIQSQGAHQSTLVKRKALRKVLNTKLCFLMSRIPYKRRRVTGKPQRSQANVKCAETGLSVYR